MIDCRLIHHPRSAEWAPTHIDQYLTYWVHRPLEKEVRNRLHAECPKPTIAHRVSNTPEFDSFMATHMDMAKQGRDPKKCIEKGLKTAQDKLLDVTSHLTQVLVLANEAISHKSTLDPLLI